MKVLMINVVCGVKSTGRICTDLAQALEAKGHEVKIAYGREDVPEKFQKYAVRIGDDMDVKFHGIKARLFDSAGFESTRVTERFLEWVKIYDPDVIHLHNIHGYYIDVEKLFEYLHTCKKKIIWTLHDCWAFTGHCAYFDFVDCKKWASQCESCPQKRSYPQSIFMDRSTRNYRKKKDLFCGGLDMTLVTPSHWLAKLLNNSFLSEYKVQVIPNGIDLDVFKPSYNGEELRAKFQNKKIILGVASVWNHRKGLQDFIKLSQRLKEEYIIILIGLKEDQMKGLPDNIVGISYTASVEELAAYYSAAEVLINPTYEDNFPTVNLEALACATPVITYNTGGSPECISPECGVVAEKGNVDDLYESIYSINKIKREACREQSQKYSKNLMYEAYLKLYDDFTEL